MTTRDLIHQADLHPVALAVALAAPPLISWVIGRFHDHGPGGAGPWRYFYAALVYLACVPGMFAGVLTLSVLAARRATPARATAVVEQGACS